MRYYYIIYSIYSHRQNFDGFQMDNLGMGIGGEIRGEPTDLPPKKKWIYILDSLNDGSWDDCGNGEKNE
jgi:hypothetical protein